MEFLSKDTLRILIETTENPCISIYMPTHRFGPETKQDPIRFKNLLKQAEKHLVTLGLRSVEINRILKPATRLVDNSIFWSYQSDGLAVFISSQYFTYYCLPIDFQELVVVTNRFHIKPLLYLFSGDKQFYILTLSQNEVGLFQGTHYNIDRIEIENLPKDIDEVLKFDTPEKQLQFHTRTPSRSGKRTAVFHGHGAGYDEKKDRILRYLQSVNKVIAQFLKDEKAPLILAGVDYLFPIYRQVNTYPYLNERGIPGNPEGRSAQELHEQAWKLIHPYFLQMQKQAAVQYRQLAETIRASHDIVQIAAAAYQGRVEKLFVAVGIQQWGKFDTKTYEVSLHRNHEPNDEDLLDFTAVQTILHKGTVFALEPKNMPENHVHLAAIFRY